MTTIESTNGPTPVWEDISTPGFNRLIGPIQIRTDEAILNQFRFVAEERHQNSRGVVHGGMLMSFADTAIGNTIRRGRRGRLQATIQLEMHFVRPAPVGATVEVSCRIVRETRNLVFADADILIGEEIVATARGVWKVTSTD